MASNNHAAFESEMKQDPAEKKLAGKQPRRLQINLVMCKSCSAGHLAPIWPTGKGKKLRWTKLAPIPLPGESVEGM